MSRVVEPLLCHFSQIAPSLYSGALRSWPSSGGRVAHEFRKPRHPWNVCLVCESGGGGHASVADGRVYHLDFRAAIRHRGGNQAFYPCMDSRLGRSCRGSSIRPRRPVSTRLFHVGFFRHDDSQSSRLSPDTRLFLFCEPRNRNLLHGSCYPTGLSSCRCREFLLASIIHEGLVSWVSS